jgi:hypothetical protein
VIESQKGQGQSNIVFSSSISVADAIRAASKLKADLKFSEIEASFVDVSDMQEDQILYHTNSKSNGVKLFLCYDIIISATAIHFLALSCDNALTSSFQR